VPNIHPAIAKMLEKYDLSSADKTYEALREILQEIVLLGLYRAGFFDHALFYGGTALRILYGLDRFSEDLDFSLVEPNATFDLSVYEDAVIEALHSFGFEVTIQLKNRDGAVKSAFLKGNTSQHLLNIEAPEDIVKTFGQGRLVKIKFEVDTQPPLDFESEKKTLLVPSPFTIHTMTIPSLFAGKMHAILCRNWSKRPKGRDWYDLDLDVTAAKRDVEIFIADSRVLDIWSRAFFIGIVDQIRFTE
jgi:predicted nucleotidyltransferase component of viral defense system